MQDLFRLITVLLLIRYAGDHPCAVSDGPTKWPQYMRISRLITVTYLLQEDEPT